MVRLFHCGGNLYSIVERIRLGVTQLKNDYASRRSDLRAGGASSVFFKLATDQESGDWLSLKPELLQRTDILTYGTDRYGNQCRGIKRLHAMAPGEQTWKSCRRLDASELMLPFISLEEVLKVHTKKNSHKSLTERMAREVEYFPNGQAISATIEDPLVRMCDNFMSRPDGDLIGDIVKAVGKDQFKLLYDLNPEIDTNFIGSLKGLTLKGTRLTSVDFRKMDLRNTTFSGMELNLCKFDQLRETYPILKFCSFINCSFYKQTPPPDFKWIESCTFTLERGDLASQTETARLLYDSCVLAVTKAEKYRGYRGDQAGSILRNLD
ncbi:pentapeptide repeat-containing protein, partial [Sansalvadorimonas verongulae]|uniref:pentapeptide repeat-containing protein n=1 Tax=Sansalvadorimonas verongulae TaxID=2172824 RepID=UPI0012BC8CBB